MTAIYHRRMTLIEKLKRAYKNDYHFEMTVHVIPIRTEGAPAVAVILFSWNSTDTSPILLSNHSTRSVDNFMTYDEILLETYTENIAELEDERAGLTYYKGFDGEIIEKYVTCKRPNCICQRGFPHGPNKYFRHREGGRWQELYLGKKIVDEYVAKVESNKRIKEIESELRVLRVQLTAVRRRLGLGDENGEGEQLRLKLDPDWIQSWRHRHFSYAKCGGVHRYLLSTSSSWNSITMVMSHRRPWTPQAYEEKAKLSKSIFVSKCVAGGEMSPVRTRLEWERVKICWRKRKQSNDELPG